MAIFKSGNPAMNVFENTITIPGSGVMTERGTLNKFFMLFLLVMASASLTWKAFYDGVDIMPYTWGGCHTWIYHRDGRHIQKRMGSLSDSGVCFI